MRNVNIRSGIAKHSCRFKEIAENEATDQSPQRKSFRRIVDRRRKQPLRDLVFGRALRHRFSKNHGGKLCLFWKMHDHRSTWFDCSNTTFFKSLRTSGSICS